MNPGFIKLKTICDYNLTKEYLMVSAKNLSLNCCGVEGGGTVIMSRLMMKIEVLKMDLTLHPIDYSMEPCHCSKEYSNGFSLSLVSFVDYDSLNKWISIIPMIHTLDPLNRKKCPFEFL